jgi:hypothetical protein
MNLHEYIKELKTMDLHEILIHLIHICVHVEQSGHLLFLRWLVCHGGTNSHSRPLENLKVTMKYTLVKYVISFNLNSSMMQFLTLALY